MRKTRVWITMGCCLLTMALFAGAQANGKPGLWEMTSTMTWQKSPMPAGMNMPPGMSSPFGASTHTMQVCLTQAMIDKYGSPMPQSRNNQCQVSNVQMKANSMTGDWICTGQMAGKGTVESSWTDSDHSTTKVHFAGNMQMGPNATPVEYTIESTSVYKGPDCGSVKPAQMPSN
jgi:hypothetical protein